MMEGPAPTARPTSAITLQGTSLRRVTPEQARRELERRRLPRAQRQQAARAVAVREGTFWTATAELQRIAGAAGS